MQKALFFSTLSIFFLFACSPRVDKGIEKTKPNATAVPPTVAAPKMPPVAVFPRDHIGDWEGKLEVFNAVKGKVQEVTMRLKIHPLKDSLGQYTYQLTYGDNGKDDRPYRLVAVDSSKQHWLVDENDGIKLDGYFIDGAFVQVFTVQGTTLICSDRLDETGNMRHEIMTYKQKAIRTSGGSSEDVPAVDSYPITGTQKAILRRKK